MRRRLGYLKRLCGNATESLSTWESDNLASQLSDPKRFQRRTVNLAGDGQFIDGLKPSNCFLGLLANHAVDRTMIVNRVGLALFVQQRQPDEKAVPPHQQALLHRRSFRHCHRSSCNRDNHSHNDRHTSRDCHKKSAHHRNRIFRLHITQRDGWLCRLQDP
jgi:hypothetical protein